MKSTVSLASTVILLVVFGTTMCLFFWLKKKFHSVFSGYKGFLTILLVSLIFEFIIAGILLFIFLT